MLCCGSIAQNTQPTSGDAWLADFLRIGVYCGGNGKCLGNYQTNVNNLYPTPTGLPYNNAACAEVIRGQRCGCGPCGESGCCVAKMSHWPDYDWYNPIDNIIQGINLTIGSSGCFPGRMEALGAWAPDGVESGCTIAYTKSCKCKMPCAETTNVQRGTGSGSVSFPAVKCGSSTCSYLCMTGAGCMDKTNRWHPCFCFAVGNK
ncbi:MAG: hypothetical protein HYY16_17885 [Planctomycetes bacterium]|nr:hypothetical protein [Planctomycetota bacterium]